jgi:hypothetical protein
MEEANERPGGAAMSRTPELWSVWLTGMDEYHAAGSRAEAMAWAHGLNIAIMARNPNPHEYDPNVWAVPQLWPQFFRAEDHAKELAENPEWHARLKRRITHGVGREVE